MATDYGHEIERLWAQLRELRGEIRQRPVGATAGGGWCNKLREADTSGTPPVISSEIGTDGAAATALKSDTKPGLKLYTTKPGLVFKPEAAGLSALWTDTPNDMGTGADLHGVESGNSIGDNGKMVHANHIHKFPMGNGLEYDGGSSIFRVKLATDPGLEFSGGGARAKVKAGGGITRDADGLSLTSPAKWKANP